MRSIVLAFVVTFLLSVIPVQAAGETIDISSLRLSAPVVPVRYYQLPSGAWTLTVPCWEAAGVWEAGENTILLGHSYHPACGGVFNALHHARVGQTVRYGGHQWEIVRVKTGIKPQESHWLWPTAERRLTLITCWPAHSVRTRMVIIARQVSNALSAPVPMQLHTYL